MQILKKNNEKKMLSAMTTSENFPLANQSGCSLSPYRSVMEPAYVATILRQDPGGEEGLLNCRLIHGANGKMTSAIYYYPPAPKRQEPQSEGSGDGRAEESDFFATEVPKGELENELTDLLDQLETDDSGCEPSRPLRIDPNVLKLDFSKLSIRGDHCSVDKLCSSDLSENKRASHHLSGGGLLTDASREDFGTPGSDSLKNRFSKLSGGSLMTAENVFDFENLGDSESGPGGASHFLNQISPSSPLTFDLTAQNDRVRNVTGGLSSEGESTNPFKNLMKDSAGEESSSFSPTNPFTDLCGSSSPNETPSINCVPPRYENISLPQKSFSQCSTRPASPVLRTSEESSVSNPFLINETSPDPDARPPGVPRFFLNDSKYPNAANASSNPSSFIFAVPVFPVFQHSITDSSTQTGDVAGATTKPEEPVYQNVTAQLRKFMKRNDHSEYDLQCLKATVKDLKNSGWYYENVSWQESVVLLTDAEPGTFLIRDSSDPNFLFSLSVQTSRGPTSVRIHYVNGQFRLDAEKKLIPHMPSFNSVIELIDYYVENTVKNKSGGRPNNRTKKPGKHRLQKSKDQVWIDSQGNVYSNILLAKPLHKRDHFSTLQHLARLTINRHIKKRLNAKVKFNFRVTPVYESSPFQDSSFQNNFDNFCPVLSMDALPLPSKLLEYLKEYPYCH